MSTLSYLVQGPSGPFVMSFPTQVCSFYQFKLDSSGYKCWRKLQHMACPRPHLALDGCFSPARDVQGYMYACSEVNGAVFLRSRQREHFADQTLFPKTFAKIGVCIKFRVPWLSRDTESWDSCQSRTQK